MIESSQYAKNSGFGLIEVLIASLLFSITVLGLLNYQKVLLEQFYAHSHSQKAWRLAQQMLETYPTLQQHPLISQLWYRQLITYYTQEGCKVVTAQVIMPDKQVAKLTRWFCTGFPVQTVLLK